MPEKPQSFLECPKCGEVHPPGACPKEAEVKKERVLTPKD
jgi:hypothetical protein